MGSLPPVFVVLTPLLSDLRLYIAEQFNRLQDPWVKTSVQGDVQCDNSTFFTALNPWARAKLCLQPQMGEKNSGTVVLWMVRTNAKVGEKQLLAARMLASCAWFHRNKNGVDILERLRIVGLQDPALLAGVVLVEHSKASSRGG